MAWELPSKPVDLNEHLQGSYEMEELQRNDINATKSNSDTDNRIDNANEYYTNIPKQKNSYDNKNQYQSPYKSYGKYDYKSPLPSNPMVAPNNKLQSYAMYADSLMKQFKRLTKTIPQNRPFSPANFQEFANV